MKYAEEGEMRDAVRFLEYADATTELTEELRNGLLENLRQVLRKTAATKHTEAIAAQSRLERWKHLRRASPEAAGAYVKVLRYLNVEVPDHLLEEV